MAVNQVTVKELMQRAVGSKNIKIQDIRTRVDHAIRKLFALQQDLSHLKSAHLLVLQNINRNQRREQLEGPMDPDRFQTQKPDQSIKQYDVHTPDPNPRINWNARKLEEEVGRSKTQLYRLDEEIKKVSGYIAQVEAEKQKGITELAELEDPNLVIARDYIAKTQYATLYMLYEICKRYKELSTNSSGGRGFSSSEPMKRKYQVLLQGFKSYADRDPDVNPPPTSKIPKLVLNFEDPGCIENENAIKSRLDQRQAVLANNDVLPVEVQRLDMKMTADVNNSYISKNISRQNEMKRLPDENNFLNKITATIDKMVDTATNTTNNVLTGLSPTGQPVKIHGVNLNSLLDATYFSDAITTGFKRLTKQLYDGMPLCSNPAETPDGTAQKLNNESLDEAERRAGIVVAKQFTESTTIISSPEALSSLNVAFADISAAINRPGHESAMSMGLDLGKKRYEAETAHDCLVLVPVRHAYDMAESFQTKGSITEADYTAYIKKIEDAIQSGTKCKVYDRGLTAQVSTSP